MEVIDIITHYVDKHQNIINVEFKGNELQISPTRTLREIRADINRMFGLRIDESGSNWGIEYKPF